MPKLSKEYFEKKDEESYDVAEVLLCDGWHRASPEDAFSVKEEGVSFVEIYGGMVLDYILVAPYSSIKAVRFTFRDLSASEEEV